MRRYFSMLLTVFVLSSCASDPAAIKPVAVSNDPYMAMDCGQLQAQLARIDAEYGRAAEQHGMGSFKDPASIAFFELTMLNAMDKSAEKDIARLKGEKEAVQQARIAKKCDVISN